MNIGFTGTREGCSEEQLSTLKKIMEKAPKDAKCNHGDCVGADKDFGRLCESLDLEIVTYPGSPGSYLKRNREIVENSQVMIACPLDNKLQRHEQYWKKGGTWYTAQHARSKAKPLILIWRDGTYTINDDDTYWPEYAKNLL